LSETTNTRSSVRRWPRLVHATGATASKLGRVASAALQRFFADRCPLHAAGIAYRVLFSIVPLAIVLVSIFGLVLQNDSIREDVVNRIVDVLPVSAAGKKDVENAVSDIATPASAAGLVSLVVFAWAATGMMGSIRQGLEAALRVTESRPALRSKAVDFALVAGAALLVLASAGLTLLGTFVQRLSGRLADATAIGPNEVAGAFLRGTSFLLAVLVVILLYRFVPSRGLRVRDGLAGAIVTALLLQLISFASGWIYTRTTELSVVYGSLTAAIVFLYSIYLYSSSLLLGAEVAAAWSLPPVEGPAEPVLVQLKRAALGLVVREKPKAP
jgi:membrane protein